MTNDLTARQNSSAHIAQKTQLAQAAMQVMFIDTLELQARTYQFAEAALSLSPQKETELYSLTQQYNARMESNLIQTLANIRSKTKFYR